MYIDRLIAIVFGRLESMRTFNHLALRNTVTEVPSQQTAVVKLEPLFLKDTSI